MRTRSFPFAAMGSDCLLHLATEGEAGALAELAIAEVRRIERKYSRYRPDSIVSRINALAGTGEACDCDDETVALLAYADTLYEASGGLFDITSGVLRRAWNFGRQQLPAPGAVEALLPLVDWSSVEWRGGAVRLPMRAMEIDFGGFGKEYAADRAATILAAAGVRHGYVNLGGDLRLVGPQPDGTPWHCAIQHPRHASQLTASIPLGGGALATSGDYERFIEVDGQRYCHILDPRSGQPVCHWQSISVAGPLAIAAGSCATIAMLMQQDALNFLACAGVAYLAIDQHGQCFRKDL